MSLDVDVGKTAPCHDGNNGDLMKNGEYKEEMMDGMKQYFLSETIRQQQKRESEAKLKKK